MAIEKKKNLLIPLNHPRRPPLWVRILIAILRPPLLVLGFIFGNLYKLCFGWYDKRLARQHEQRFADDIRSYLPFLFSEHDGACDRRGREFAVNVYPGSRRFLRQSRVCFCSE